jgi:hypothetical protein
MCEWLCVPFWNLRLQVRPLLLTLYPLDFPLFLIRLTCGTQLNFMTSWNYGIAELILAWEISLSLLYFCRLFKQMLTCETKVGL